MLDYVRQEGVSLQSNRTPRCLQMNSLCAKQPLKSNAQEMLQAPEAIVKGEEVLIDPCQTLGDTTGTPDRQDTGGGAITHTAEEEEGVTAEVTAGVSNTR